MKLMLRKYLKKNDNKFVLIILGLTIIWGMFGSTFLGIFGPSKEPWKNWEDASIFFTMIYTVWLYFDGFFISAKFEGIGIKRTGLIVSACIALMAVVVLLIIDFIHRLDLTTHLQFPRYFVMVLLLISAALFSSIDFLLGEENKDYSSGYNKIFYYSDLPITFVFAILFLYSLMMNGNAICDPFFSGAIAFQMMLSNLLWSFMDDKVFEYKTEK